MPQSLYQDIEESEGIEDQWQDLKADSPEETIVTYPSSPSPPDDVSMYKQRVKRQLNGMESSWTKKRLNPVFLLGH